MATTYSPGTYRVLITDQGYSTSQAGNSVFYVQFKVLARLGLDSPTGSLRMTELADEVVYSRSGLTYQAGLLDKAGLITRHPSADDERSTTVTITDAGRAVVARVLPGHVEVVRRLLVDPLSRRDLGSLGSVLTRVRDHMRAAPPRSAKPRSRGKPRQE